MLEDVIDGYVSVRRAERDYGVVIHEVDAELDEYEIDEAATAARREEFRAARTEWLNTDPEEVARGYREGELDVYDVVRRHGVILEWGSGELLPKTTEQYRETMQRRSASAW